MCLLDRVEAWDGTLIRCVSSAHADLDNPLRRGSRLPAVCTIEFGLQAMALHGALVAGGPQRPGFVTSLTDVEVALGDADGLAGLLTIEATIVASERRGYVYRFRVAAGAQPVAAGRALIMVPEVPG